MLPSCIVLQARSRSQLPLEILVVSQSMSSARVLCQAMHNGFASAQLARSASGAADKIVVGTRGQDVRRFRHGGCFLNITDHEFLLAPSTGPLSLRLLPEMEHNWNV